MRCNKSSIYTAGITIELYKALRSTKTEQITLMALSSNNVEGNDAFKKALRLLSSEGLDGAIMVVERELESDPENWEAWSAKADILYFQGNYDASMRCCERSIRLNSQNALAFNIKGNVFYKLGKYKEAIECYNKAIEIEPLFVKAWYNKKMASELALEKSRLRVHYLVPRESSQKKR
jgi:tetratricopeptide (TPR) repeat protein